MGPPGRTSHAQVRLIWTEPALWDLGSIRAYISVDSTAAADRQLDKVFVAVARLSQFPESGRPGRHAGTRELVIAGTPYVIPYRVRGDIIQVLRVLHGRRRWPDRV